MIYAMLFNAIRQKDVDMFQACISESRIDVNKVRHGHNILDIAIASGSVEIVDLLLNHPNINVNRQKHHIESPLHFTFMLTHSPDNIYKKGTFIENRKHLKMNHRKIMGMLLRHPSMDYDQNEDIFF